MQNITAKYYKDFTNKVAGIQVTVEGSDRILCVPLNPENADYAEIMRQVEAGELTIQDVD